MSLGSNGELVAACHENWSELAQSRTASLVVDPVEESLLGDGYTRLSIDTTEQCVASYAHDLFTNNVDTLMHELFCLQCDDLFHAFTYEVNYYRHIRIICVAERRYVIGEVSECMEIVERISVWRR